MKKVSFYGVIVSIAMAMIVGCGGGGGGGSPVTTGVTGKITDMSGKVLTGVTVFSGDKSAKTDEEGKYTLSIGKAGEVTVSAKTKNYMQNSKLVTLTEGKTASLDMKLLKIDAKATFDATAGKKIMIKGAAVELPANGFKTKDGGVYNGKVTANVTYNRVTTQEGLEAFPGGFLGEDTHGDKKVLKSYGFIDVTLEGASGEALALDGKAKLTYPLDPTMKAPADGDTIPLWYFDTKKGIWVEEGLATYDAAAKTYGGEVAHFTTWNLDAKMNGGTIEGCVEDSAGNRVPIADIYVTAPGWIKSFTNNDPNGDFMLINAPADTNISLVAVHNGWASKERNVTVAAGAVVTTEQNGTMCLVLDQNASDTMIEIKGTFMDVNGAVISNQYFNVTMYDTEGNYVAGKYSQSGADGTFSLSSLKNKAVAFRLETNYNGVEFSKKITINAGASKVDFGTFVLAVTTVHGCVTLEDGVIAGDGSVRDVNTGRTSFGTYKREVLVNAPYPEFHWKTPDTFDSIGDFTVTMAMDNAPHVLYAHLWDDGNQTLKLTGQKTITADSTTVNFGAGAAECIPLHQTVVLNQQATASIETTNSGVALWISTTPYWDDILKPDQNKTSYTFTIDKNRIYSVDQMNVGGSDDMSFNGTMTFEVGGSTYVITIPDKTAQGEWAGFSVEAYDGQITVHKINQSKWR